MEKCYIIIDMFLNTPIILSYTVHEISVQDIKKTPYIILKAMLTVVREQNRGCIYHILYISAGKPVNHHCCSKCKTTVHPWGMPGNLSLTPIFYQLTSRVCAGVGVSVGVGVGEWGVETGLWWCTDVCFQTDVLSILSKIHHVLAKLLIILAMLPLLLFVHLFFAMFVNI